MLSRLTFLKIFLLSLLFTGALFGLQMYLSFNFSDTLAEENYIEKSLYDDDHNHDEKETILIEKEPVDIDLHVGSEKEKEVIDDYLEKEKEKSAQLLKNEARQIFFSYIPSTLKSSIGTYKDTTRTLINDDEFEDKIKDLTVEFHEEMIDVRGKMKNKTIKIFDPLQMPSSEFIAIFTHEFAHYLDLYYFSKTPFGDTSNEFYNISWESSKTMRKGQKSSDFVSGYAMTNKYEDFAETLTYYIFHNTDFKKKSEKSQVLLWKYRFFSEYLFKNDFFVGTDFSPNNKIKKYYWDITKIEIDSENFLQYLQKDI